MMPRVQLLQAFARNVGVNLRGGNVGMPEQQLHDAKIGAVIQEMRGKRVPQSVGR